MMSQASFASGLFMAVKKCHKRFCKQTASTACWSFGFLALYACMVSPYRNKAMIGAANKASIDKLKVKNEIVIRYSGKSRLTRGSRLMVGRGENFE